MKRCLHGLIALILPGSILLGAFVLWAMGLPVLTREPADLSLPKLGALSLVLGLFLALPWIYAFVRLLLQPPF